MAKKKQKIDYKVADVTLIPILTFKEIQELFDISQKDIRKSLDDDNCDNYWYPGELFDEETTLNIVYLFNRYAADTTVLNKTTYKYIEIFLNTEDKHIFKYSIINFFKNL